MVAQNPPHCVVTERGEEEELELLGELLERLGGREEGSQSRSSSEDRVVLLLGCPRIKLPSDILLLMDLFEAKSESETHSSMT